MATFPSVIPHSDPLWKKEGEKATEKSKIMIKFPTLRNLSYGFKFFSTYMSPKAFLYFSSSCYRIF